MIATFQTNYYQDDKLKAKTADTDFVATCFDLEEVLLTPHSFESVLYSKRRLNTFNFTLNNMGTIVFPGYQ